MHKNLLSWLALIPLVYSCSKTPPNISVACEENNVGNCIIKWEVAPLIKGHVKVYASTDPNAIRENDPIAAAPIADGRMTIVTNDPTKRYYYTMVFNNEYRVKTATRNINIPGIQNFRDLGGYKSIECDKFTRWGMLYRSAQIDSLDASALKELQNLGIKTIIDLRSPTEINHRPQLQKDFQVVHIPIATGNMEKILQDVQEGKIKGDTIYKIMERMNRELVMNYQTEYHELFRILLNRNNYPAVIHCTSGKGRTGIVSALVLAALGVNEDIIMEDYRLSNYFFNIPKASTYAYKLPTNSQEAITTVYSAKEDFLNAAKEEIEKKHGGVTAYLKKGIGLKCQDLKQLQSFLLE